MLNSKEYTRAYYWKKRAYNPEYKKYRKAYSKKYYWDNKEKEKLKREEFKLKHPKIYLYDKKICYQCKKGNVVLIKSSKSGVHQYFLCRECNTKKMKEYRLTKRGKLVISINGKKTYIKNKNKSFARSKLNEAIKRGLIKKPNKCSVCDKDTKIEGHHSDYSKPLEVTWLCRSCHADLHRLTKT